MSYANWDARAQVGLDQRSAWYLIGVLENRWIPPQVRVDAAEALAELQKLDRPRMTPLRWLLHALGWRRCTKVRSKGFLQ